MNRRNIRNRRTIGRAWIQDPFAVLVADMAWRAEEATDNGSVTTGLVNYVGASLTLPRQGTGQAIKAASALLNNRMAIAFAPTAGLGAYGNVVALGASPTNFTVATVGRYTTANRGLFALTAAGAANSGVSLLQLTGTSARKITTDASAAGAAPRTIVQVAVFTAAGITNYVNSFTAVTASLASALAGTSIHIGGITTSDVFVLDGLWATTAYWTRALTAAEARFALTHLGRKYGVAIAA